MGKLYILHLEDSASDAFFVQRAITQSGLEVEIFQTDSRAEFITRLKQGGVDLILADNCLPGFDNSSALKAAREHSPQTPFIIVSGTSDETLVVAGLQAGATDFVPKNQLWQLPIAIRRALAEAGRAASNNRMEQHGRAMQRLVTAVQELSMARDLESIMTIVRQAARELTGADGATFILRDRDQCYYADENAISPLWKGQRFPLTACISGWAMLNRQPAIIEDIYVDPRIPINAYRPTFVKSLVMVPIRTESPIGAIGNYWARPHLATTDEVELLQALANTTSVAMENVQLYAELEQRVRDRTLQLEVANRELEAFSYSVSHDLRAPLRAIGGYTHLLTEEHQASLATNAKTYLGHIHSEVTRMSGLIEDLLRLARFARLELKHEKVNLTILAQEQMARLQAAAPDRPAEFRIQRELETLCDQGLIRIVLENLFSNAWKYSSQQPQTLIEFGSVPQSDGGAAFFVRDHGAGFDMRYADKLFAPFQRLHHEREFAGTGVGLATVQRIIHRHGGRIWAEAAVNAGATFFFTLPPGPLKDVA